MKKWSELGVYQEEFAEAFGRLLTYAASKEIKVRIKDAYRDPRLHGAWGKKQGYGAACSTHKVSLAVDLYTKNEAERIAAKDLQTSDAVIADFFEILNDSRLTHVNLSLRSTQDGVDYLLSKLEEIGVVAEDDVPARRAAILSGQFV